MTIGPGDVYWSRFGHNAIWVEDPASGASAMYNYGIFDLAEEDFLLNFARGRMRYLLAAFDAEDDLAAYRRAGRRLTVQRLALTPSQADELVRFLELNRLPENRSYLYDYYLDNCSTRVRDALDQVLGGQIRRHFAGRPALGGTFRDHTNRLAAPDLWVYLGTDFALGPAADAPISRWDEFFLPMEFAAGLKGFQVAGPGGAPQPLVRETLELPVIDPIPEPAERPGWWWLFGLGGTALALALALAGRARRAIVPRAWWLLSGLLGVGLLTLWLATDHAAAHANRNLLLYSPLGLLLAFAPLERRWARGVGVLLGLSLLAAVVGALIAPLGAGGQRYLDWLLLALPPQLAALFHLFTGRAAPTIPTRKPGNS